MLMKRKDAMDVFKPFEEVQREMNRLFDDVFRGNNLRTGIMKEDTLLAGVDIYEKDGVVYFEIDLPGLDKKDIELKIAGNILTVKAERKYEKSNEGESKNYHISERYFGSLQRSFTLPENVDYEAIKAKYENGVLKVELPRTENIKKPSQIEIE